MKSSALARCTSNSCAGLKKSACGQKRRDEGSSLDVRLEPGVRWSRLGRAWHDGRLVLANSDLRSRAGADRCDPDRAEIRRRAAAARAADLIGALAADGVVRGSRYLTRLCVDAHG